MCKGQTSTTSATSSTPNPTALAAYNSLLAQAPQVAAAHPYQSYTGQLVAPLNAEGKTGIAGINNFATAAQPAISQGEGLATQGAGLITSGAIPYLQESAGLIQGAAQPLSTAQINQYMSPYTQDVVNATEQQFNLQNAQQQNQVVGNAAAQGALGGNRTAVAEAQLAGQQQTAEAPVIAGLYNTAYNTGLSTAEQEFQNNPMTAAYGFGNVATGFSNNAAGLAGIGQGIGSLGIAGQNAGLQGAGTQLQASTEQEQLQTANDQALLQQWEQQQAFPYQQLSWEAGLDTGVGSLMGGFGTGYTQGPTPSVLGPLAGLGIAGLGAFAKDGGRIPEYDAGGAAPGVGNSGFYGEGSSLYGGVGYLPTLPITHGPGPPQPPNSQQQQQATNPLGGVNPKAIMSGFKGAQNLFGGSGDWAGGPEDDSAFDVGGLGEAAGGRIPHFDTGGGADDDGVMPPSSGWGSFASSDSFLPPDQPIQVADASGNVPRGIRNNNPLNIEDGPFTRKEPGYAGIEPKGRFAQFNSPESGINAASDLLANYGSKGINTVRGIVDRWAPASDGNDDAAYAGFVAKKLGISPNDPLDMHNPETLNHVARAMAVFESGYKGDGSSAPVGGGVSTHGLPHVAQSADTSGVASDASKSGLFGLHLSDAARQGLIGAGLGMMASGSPYPLQQIGQGGLQGLQAYSQAKTRDLAVQRLGIEAQKAQSEIAKQSQETENLKTTGAIGKENLRLYQQGNGTAPVSPVQVQPVPPPAPPPAAAARGPATPPQGQVSSPPTSASGAPPAPAPQATQANPQLDPRFDPAALRLRARQVAPINPQMATQLNKQAEDIERSKVSKDVNGNVVPLPGYGEAQAAAEAPAEVQKLAIKEGADRLKEFNTAGQQADANRQTIALERPLINDPNFNSGSGVQFQDAISKLGVKLGLSHPDRATPGEVYDKLRSSSILDQIKGMKGTGPIRVAEMNFIDKMIAGRENTGQSIRDLVEIEDRVNKRMQGVRTLAQNYIAQGHPYLDNNFEMQLAAYVNDPKNALFTDEEQRDPRLIAPPVFKNEAQFRAARLPRGYPFKVQGMEGIGYAQ